MSETLAVSSTQGVEVVMEETSYSCSEASTTVEDLQHKMTAATIASLAQQLAALEKVPETLSALADMMNALDARVQTLHRDYLANTAKVHNPPPLFSRPIRPATGTPSEGSSGASPKARLPLGSSDGAVQIQPLKEASPKASSMSRDRFGMNTYVTSTPLIGSRQAPAPSPASACASACSSPTKLPGGAGLPWCSRNATSPSLGSPQAKDGDFDCVGVVVPSTSFGSRPRGSLTSNITEGSSRLGLIETDLKDLASMRQISPKSDSGRGEQRAVSLTVHHERRCRILTTDSVADAPATMSEIALSDLEQGQGGIPELEESTKEAHSGFSDSEDVASGPGARSVVQQQRPTLRRNGVMMERGRSGMSLKQRSTVWLARQQSIPQFVLSPYGMPRLLWDVLMVSTMVVIGFLVPIRVVYLIDYKHSNLPMLVIFSIADIVLTLDIPLNFCTAHISGRSLVVSHRRLACLYLRSWFLLDLLAAVPTVLFQSHGIIVVCMVKLVRLLRLMPLTSKIQIHFPLLPVMQVRIMLVLLLVANSLACVWRLAQRIDTHLDDSLSVVEDGRPWGTQYLADLYWVVMTMTTVGYGDIVPSGNIGRICSILAMLTGTFMFGFILSMVGRVLGRVFDEEVESQVKQAVKFMRHRRVPRNLQLRVKQNLTHNIRKDSGSAMRVPQLLSKLTPSLQKELSLELLRNVVLSFPLFKDAPIGFAAEIAQAHQWIHAFQGDTVVEEGQLVQEMIFVVKGRLAMLAPGEKQVEQEDGESGSDADSSSDDSDRMSKEEGVEEYLDDGAWLGEKALFMEDHVRTCTVMAATDCELAVLPIQEYKAIIKRHPRMWERHRQTSKWLESGCMSYRNLRYKDSKDPSKNPLLFMNSMVSPFTKVARMTMSFDKRTGSFQSR
mmetsp:Transcript_39557/g.93137  ORF Transcript_39557/g.93137 Transcript_39557/m.93137 type:complete len:897 (+) Transcript_39557:36-2726(+)